MVEIIFVHRQPKNIRKSLRMYIVNMVKSMYHIEAGGKLSYTELFKIADVAARDVLDSRLYPSDEVILDKFMDAYHIFMEVYHAEQKNLG